MRIKFLIVLSVIISLQLSCIAHDKMGTLNIDTVEQSEIKDTNQYFATIDTAYPLYRLPVKFEKPAKWKQVDWEREGQKRIGYCGNNDPGVNNISTVLTIISTAKDYRFICAALSWCVKNYQAAFPHLVARLSDKTKVGLINCGDLIIWDRIETKELKFYGHGGGIFEDIFTIAGRASWILNEITGEDFAVVRADLAKEEAAEMKQKWIAYIAALR